MVAETRKKFGKKKVKNLTDRDRYRRIEKNNINEVRIG